MSLKAAEEALPKIVAIMADELGWDDKEKLRQTDLAIQFLRWFEVFFCCLRFSQLSVVDPDYLNPGLDAGFMLKFSSDIDTPLFFYWQKVNVLQLKEKKLQLKKIQGFWFINAIYLLWCFCADANKKDNIKDYGMPERIGGLITPGLPSTKRSPQPLLHSKSCFLVSISLF